MRGYPQLTQEERYQIPLVTLVERKSLYTVIRFVTNKTANAVRGSALKLPDITLRLWIQLFVKGKKICPKSFKGLNA